MSRKTTAIAAAAFLAASGLGALTYHRLIPALQTRELYGPAGKHPELSGAWYADAGTAAFLLAALLAFLVAVFLLWRESRKEEADLRRRDTLLGLLVGLPLAALIPEALRRRRYRAPILPPGSRPAAEFAAACSRCYLCVQSCPSGILAARRAGNLDELLMAEVQFQNRKTGDLSSCNPECNQCSQLCPTGAIEPLELAEKRKRQIGLAVVMPETCIAWHDAQPCMACRLACPYQAIISSTIRTEAGELERPVIDPNRCRGCNACVVVCVAEEKALRVEAVACQKQLA